MQCRSAVCHSLPTRAHADAVYIATEGNLSERRLRQIAAERSCRAGPDAPSAEAVLGRIHIAKAHDADTLMTLATAHLPAIIAARPVRVVIVDSVAGVFRGEWESRAEAPARAQVLTGLGHCLGSVSARHGIPVVAVNQVADWIDDGCAGAARDRRVVVPALGLAWANCVTMRLLLTRSGGAADGGGRGGLCVMQR